MTAPFSFLVIFVGLLVAAHGAASAQSPDKATEGAAQHGQATSPRAGQDNAPEASRETPAAELPPISGAAELLSLYGLDAARLSQFVDGRAVGEDEQQVLLRLLMTIRKFSLLDIHRWMQTGTQWSQLAERPAENRGRILEIRGRLQRVSLIEPPVELAERFEMPRYYRCEVLLGDPFDDTQPAPATLYTLAVPEAWAIDEPLDERFGAEAFFVKLSGRPPGEAARPVFVSRRAAWYPPDVLGDLGMDAGLLDSVRQRTVIQAGERECFYQLLAATRRAGMVELLRRARGRFSVEPLFNRPDEQKGKLVALTGTARRAVLVRVDDPDIVDRFGIDHYYEIALFTEDSQGNPIFFCVSELPNGMPTGENIYEPVRIAGFFFKVWGYRREPDSQEQAADPEAVHRQLAPLLIGRQPYRIQDEGAPFPYIGWTFSALFVLTVIGMWFAVWHLNRGDRQFRKTAIDRQFLPEEGASLDKLNLEDRGGPDFSHLQ